jgi:hypothetical protein
MIAIRLLLTVVLVMGLLVYASTPEKDSVQVRKDTVRVIPDTTKLEKKSVLEEQISKMDSIIINKKKKI